MFDKIEIMRMSHALAQHAGARQEVVARNIANADTPGYRAQDTAAFTDAYERMDGPDVGLRATREDHIHAEPTRLASLESTIDSGGAASPDGNTVSVETEMMKSAEVKLQHDMATSIYKSSLDILRASIGRGR